MNVKWIPSFLQLQTPQQVEVEIEIPELNVAEIKAMNTQRRWDKLSVLNGLDMHDRNREFDSK